MDNFKDVYKILSALEKPMDKEKADVESFDWNALAVSETRRIST